MKEIKIEIGKLFDAISKFEELKFEQNKEVYQKTKLKVLDETNNWIDVKALIKKKDRIRKLKFSNGSSFRCAEKHLISFNKKDCVFASSLNLGDSVLLSDNSIVYVEENKKDGKEEVYDIFVDSKNHLYQTSNKFIHHNTTLALNTIAEVQRAGGIAAFVDAEHALDPKWAKKRGVNLDELLISQPECGEEALEIAEELIESGQVQVVVIDSVAALIPRAELEKDMGESSMGLQARLMSQACRKLTGMIAKTGTIVIFLNQVRDSIGGYGNPQCVTPDTLVEVEF